MEKWTELIAFLADNARCEDPVMDDKHPLAWELKARPGFVMDGAPEPTSALVRAATKTIHGDHAAAINDAMGLRQQILDLGFEVTRVDDVEARSLTNFGANIDVDTDLEAVQIHGWIGVVTIRVQAAQS
ncbi:hypothetical protein [Georgenia sp. AZ-5]|uniref:hypothetical protein n=1 Tax=Georgenia sp. AZ-5 TaxID=3367526 RepID=UPI0037546490